MIGWWALLAAVAVTLVIGLVWRAREGRVRTAGKTAAGAGVAGSVSDQLPDGLRARLGDLDGSGVTLLQLSTTFCAPCRHTRILLGDLAGRIEGMRHVEVDLTDHPEWSTPLGVHRTPTTLALDGHGRELFRVGGVPRRAELTAALRQHLP